VLEITTKPDTPSIRKNLVIVDTTRGSSSSTVEEHLGFWIDEAAKTLVLADGTALAVRRFDDHWIRLLAATCPMSSTVKTAT
jgi:hypothetical protein